MQKRKPWALLAFLALVAAQPALAGSIEGVVKVQAEKIPPPRPLKMDADPDCARRATGKFSERYVVDAHKNVKNAFVYIKSGLDLEEEDFEVPEEAAVLDQRGCRYIPHVLGIMAGQPLEILNSDGILHNIHTHPRANKEVNKPMTALKKKLLMPGRLFARPEIMVPFKCDVHPWMKAYVGVLPHPFFAVSAADGHFEIEEVPPGKYVVEVWHEFFANQRREVEVGAETVRVDFALKPPARKR